MNDESPWRNDGKSFVSYAFDGKAGQRIHLSASSKSLRLGLEVTDIRGAVIGKDENRIVGRDPLLFMQLPEDGRYLATVLSAYKSEGQFTFNLQPMPEPTLLATPMPIAAGETLPVEFSANSPILSEASYRPYALFVVRGRNGDRFRLSTAQDSTGDSSAAETVLQLQVGKNTAVGFGSARTVPSSSTLGLQFQFREDGEVLVRIAGPPGMVGRFTVKLEANPPSPPTEVPTSGR
jgi:hypothetical protein